MVLPSGTVYLTLSSPPLMFLGLNLRNVGLVAALNKAFAGLKQTFATGGVSSLGNAIPGGASQVVVKAWGAGGTFGYDDGANSVNGGGAAFVKATILVGSGYTFDYWVGAAGNGSPGSMGGRLCGIRIKDSGGATVGWVLSPGGGAGGLGNNLVAPGGKGGSAAGQNGDPGSENGGIPAGAGGVGATSGAGGAGGASAVGGTNGANGTGPFTSSQIYNGGSGGNDGIGNQGGGGDGGGGNYGGGGGGSGAVAGSGGGGGAGSLFVSGQISTTNENASNVTPGGTSDPDYALPAGRGGEVGVAQAGAGRLVLIWS